MEVVNSEFDEVDPTGRYGRYNEVLGKGASKIVYRAFDEYEGIEVAWNQVKLNDYLHNSQDLERLCSEIHLLKTLNHDNIMKFYNSWVDTRKMNINFITEMFTSGTLRQYRQKHKRVHIRAIKDWCRQILRGLNYLHNLSPPVIHRDLKCDNIFINGNQGEVKIGDLGLAAILRKSHADHCVGTPEFMAPEVYQEEYNELVDIYSFGMCILEMITFEYPYSECSHPVQIYKKVMNGKKPDALNKVKDPAVRRFIGKCLATVSLRQSARELLNDPFLQEDDCGASLRSLEWSRRPLPRQPLFPCQNNDSFINEYHNNQYQNVGLRIETDGRELFMYNEDKQPKNMDITIKGKRKENGEIFLRIKITDKEGLMRNIYFPFDIENDTALSVATEMVMELELTDYDVTTIAEMIDGEIACLVPEWQIGSGIEETDHDSSAEFCRNCASNRTSNGSLIDYGCLNYQGAQSLQVLPCLKEGCASMHGRFGAITYQVKPEHCVVEGAPDISGHSDENHHTHTLDQNEECELNLQGSGNHGFERKEHMNHLLSDGNECVVDKNVIVSSYGSKLYQNTVENSPELNHSPITPPTCAVEDDYENEIRQELRWIKASYQMELMNLKNERTIGHSRAPSWSPDNAKHKTETPIPNSPVSTQLSDECDKLLLLKSFLSGNHYSCGFEPIQNSCPDSETQRDRHCEASTESISPQHMHTARNFYATPVRPLSMHRSTSLLVDAVDV